MPRLTIVTTPSMIKSLSEEPTRAFIDGVELVGVHGICSDAFSGTLTIELDSTRYEHQVIETEHPSSFNIKDAL